jgi:phosphoglycolate phosphatase-like HAD superfamily hydrolase
VTAPPEPGAAVLVVDFDGVIADALDECALVTWYAQRPFAAGIPGDLLLAAVPSGFRRRFAAVRNHARLLEHFAVALAPKSAEIRTADDFERFFRRLPADAVRSFGDGATRVRTLLREQQPEFWCRAHKIYPGIPELLSRSPGPVHVVTAKDAASTWALLTYHGLGGSVASVLGDCADKPAAVRRICADAGVPPESATFLDDNLANVRAVAETGARARWALWGWHTPEHERQARDAGVVAVELEDLEALLPQGHPSCP